MANESRLADRTNTFGGAVLETYQVASGPRVGNSFADLQIAQNTGVRVIAIQRGDQRIVNPTGEERLLENDQLLLFGTLDRVRHFRQWLAMADTLESAS